MYKVWCYQEAGACMHSLFVVGRIVGFFGGAFMTVHMHIHTIRKYMHSWLAMEDLHAK